VNANTSSIGLYSPGQMAKHALGGVRGGPALVMLGAGVMQMVSDREPR
jgi:hypothetical protein